MSGIKKLDLLMHSMQPKQIKGKFVFCAVPSRQFKKLKIEPILVFREKEGITLILEKKTADQKLLAYQNTWAMITLTVHSDLSAVGFLAAVTKKLAENQISVNAVSAYYHDHLFVPYGKAKKAMNVLKKSN